MEFNEFKTISIGSIDSSKFDYRNRISDQSTEAWEHLSESLDKLADSLRNIGQIHPIVVRALPDGKYELVTGHLRLEAMKRLGMTEVLAVVIEASDHEAIKIIGAENTARVQWNPVAMANWARDLKTLFGLPLAEIADEVGCADTEASKLINALDHLHPDLLRLLSQDCLKWSEAKTLLPLKNDQEQQVAVFESWKAKSGVIRDLERLVRQAKNGGPEDTGDALRLQYPGNVNIEQMAKGYKLTIKFQSRDELEASLKNIHFVDANEDGIYESAEPSASNSHGLKTDGLEDDGEATYGPDVAAYLDCMGTVTDTDFVGQSAGLPQPDYEEKDLDNLDALEVVAAGSDHLALADISCDVAANVSGDEALGAPEVLLTPKKASVLDDYIDYLQERMDAGQFNTNVLFDEIKDLGYGGGRTTLKKHIKPFRS